MIIGSHKRVLIIYQDQNGKEPIIDWIEVIKDITDKAKIQNRLRRIELGNLGDYKSERQPSAFNFRQYS
jgi:putative component of toxin-antitoxin plasmid stabilization module